MATKQQFIPAGTTVHFVAGSFTAKQDSLLDFDEMQGRTPFFDTGEHTGHVFVMPGVAMRAADPAEARG